jgi:hypothetical protein
MQEAPWQLLLVVTVILKTVFLRDRELSNTPKPLGFI